MMRNGIHVGRIFGINIYVDWSWIFIFLLVTWNLAAAVFPSVHPEWSLTLNIVLGVIASLLFFASVLAHELAHSVVAKARGLPVRRITLFIFGGASNIEREPPSPLTEFLMAIVGPVTSLVLGIVFLLIGQRIAGIPLNTTNPMQSLAQLNPLSTMLLWLGPINIILAIFNLIPGFPLDGGRVLRSIFWAATKNLRQATHWASAIGQMIAWLFILSGLAMILGFNIPFLGTGMISGLWLAFIGWFLLNAATASYRQVVLEDVLEGVPVSRLMRADPPSISPDLTISRLVDEYLMGTDERAFPVVQDDRLQGLVCLEDVRKVPREKWETTQVNQIMTPASELETASPREDVTDALRKIAGRDVRQVPVMQEGKLVGMLRRRDILRWMQLHEG